MLSRVHGLFSAAYAFHWTPLPGAQHSFPPNIALRRWSGVLKLFISHKEEKHDASKNNASGIPSFVLTTHLARRGAGNISLGDFFLT